MKFATFLVRPAGETREAFHAWLAAEYLPRIAAAPELRGAVVRLARDLAPAEYPVHAPQRTESAFPVFEALVETWFSTTEEFRRASRTLDTGLLERGAGFISLRVTPWLEKDPRIAEAGPSGARPAMTWVSPVTFLPGLAPAEARRHWDEHVPIALRVHRGLTKYERNWVDEVMARSPDVPAFDAYADFAVARMEDFRENFFPAPEDIREIGADIADFLDRRGIVYLTDAAPLRV